MKTTMTLAVLFSVFLTTGRAMATDQATLKQALDEAYLDEFRAETRYEKGVQQFGYIRPFSRILQAERNHLRELDFVYDWYGLEPPALRLPVPADFSSIQQACKESVAAEQRNVQMYERLEQKITEPDILAVFENLRLASKDHHLPALQRCASY